MCGSNLPSVGISASPSWRERVGELAVDQADPVLKPGLFGRAGRLERTLEIVEDGHELADQPLVGARGQLLLVARHPLAVVVELGLQTLERVEILVALTRAPPRADRPAPRRAPLPPPTCSTFSSAITR